MAIDIQNLFNAELPAALRAKPAEAQAINTKVQLVITGEGGGAWFIDCTATGPSVTPGEHTGAVCTLRLEASDFQALHENPVPVGMKLFMTGKLEVTGDPMVALKLQKLFELRP